MGILYLKELLALEIVGKFILHDFGASRSSDETRFLLRSEKEYGPETHKFRPERFLDGSAKVKSDPAFGFGRR